MAKMSTTSKHTTAAVALMTTPRFHPGSRWVRWCLVMPAPAIVKPVNTPMAYIGMRAGHPGPGGDQQGDGCDRQHDDAVGEDQPVAPDGQGAGEEGVLGDEAHEEREAGEAGVGGQDQDERGRRLQAAVQQRADRAVP